MIQSIEPSELAGLQVFVTLASLTAFFVNLGAGEPLLKLMV